MPLRAILRNLVRVVTDEAERNPEFAERLWAVLESAKPTRSPKRSEAAKGKDTKARRPLNRRPPAVIDPVAIAAEGEEVLRMRLEKLTLEQLKDIVSEYGMDRERLVMKWKTPSRIVDRIVEISIVRARKGTAFRS